MPGLFSTVVVNAELVDIYEMALCVQCHGLLASPHNPELAPPSTDNSLGSIGSIRSIHGWISSPSSSLSLLSAETSSQAMRHSLCYATATVLKPRFLSLAKYVTNRFSFNPPPLPYNFRRFLAVLGPGSRVLSRGTSPFFSRNDAWLDMAGSGSRMGPLRGAMEASLTNDASSLLPVFP